MLRWDHLAVRKVGALCRGTACWAAVFAGVCTESASSLSYFGGQLVSLEFSSHGNVTGDPIFCGELASVAKHTTPPCLCGRVDKEKGHPQGKGFKSFQERRLKGGPCSAAASVSSPSSLLQRPWTRDRFQSQSRGHMVDGIP